MTKLNLGLLMLVGPLGAMFTIGIIQLIKTMVFDIGWKATVLGMATLLCMIVGVILIITSTVKPM